MKSPKPYAHVPAFHIVALGSPWTDACGMALLSGNDSEQEVRNLAITSCSAEMAMEPLGKILERVHESHADIVGIHPALRPVQDHIKTAIAALAEAEKCYKEWYKTR